jgi:hypothetical protein
MDILIAFGIAVASLVTIDLIAPRFGVDSRDGIDDDRHGPLRRDWL